MSLGTKAIGTWSGGRFMHFGEELDDDRLAALLRPGMGVNTVLTADVYGEGAADRLLGATLVGLDRDEYRLVGAVGHDFHDGERQGAKGFPRFTDPALRGPGSYADYLHRATERSLTALGVSRFDLLLLHNPDRIGFESKEVWDGMAALRNAGLTDQIGIAPGPANGFSLDLLACFDRFGELIDWAMIILNPLEPWPGSLVLDAAAQADVRVITRVVDYGGLFWGDLEVSTPMGEHDHRRFRPDGWIERGLTRIDRLRPLCGETGQTLMQLACQWNLAHPAVECVVPTLIQEAGDGARPVEDKRRELAGLTNDMRLRPDQVAAIAAVGDNVGTMKLKGASAAHDGPDAADRWGLSEALIAAGASRGIDPKRDL